MNISRVYNNGDSLNSSSLCTIPDTVQLNYVYIVIALVLLLMVMIQNGATILLLNISPDDRNVSRTINSVIMSSTVLYGFSQSPVWIQYLSSSRLIPSRDMVYICFVVLPGMFHTIFLWTSVLLAVHRCVIMMQPTNKHFWANQPRFIKYITIISLCSIALSAPRIASITSEDCVFSGVHDLVQQSILLASQVICCLILAILVSFLTKKLWEHYKRRQILSNRRRHTKYTVLESNTIIISAVTLIVETIDVIFRTRQLAVCRHVSDLSLPLSVTRLIRLVIYGQHIYIHVLTSFKLQQQINSCTDRIGRWGVRAIPLEVQ